MTPVIVVLVGFVAGFAGSRVLRTVRSSSNIRDRSARPPSQGSSVDRLRQLEADRALQQRPAAARPPVPNVAPPATVGPPSETGERIAGASWRTVDPAAEPTPAPAGDDQTRLAGSANPYLVREGAASGETHPLTGTAVTIGRGSDRDLRLDEPRASRQHGTFRPRRSGPGWTYTDLGSSNGTRINGRPVTPNQRIELRDGDTIEIGPTRFTFHAATAPPVQPPGPAHDPDRTQVLDIDDDGTSR